MPARTLAPLPIDEVLPQIVVALRTHPSVVIQAPTGAGKTTRVAPTILDAGLAEMGRIIVLEPRRLAARAAARRMSEERGCRLGDEVGYQVRFDRCFSRETRILVVTEGVLLAMLQGDPFLDRRGEAVSTIIFDEFHERSLDNDLALGMARLLQQTVRPDLRIVVMSATLAVEPVSRYLGNAPIVQSQGRLFPIETIYCPRPHVHPWPEAIEQAAAWLLKRTSGDLLVFLPGLQEIRQTARQLAPLAEKLDLLIAPLHGDLPAEQQDAALQRQSRRKVVLATNVAETSVTVEGITGVIDSGQARMMLLDAHLGLDRLQLVPISQASADQRAGRAGRTAPGVCLRLWSEQSHRHRPLEMPPEIRRVDLAGAILHLLAWGQSDPGTLPWFEPPHANAMDQAFGLLARLGAVANRQLTDLGRRLARLPVHPRLGRLLVEGHRLGQPEMAALAAALLAERDPWVRSLDQAPLRKQSTATRSDVLARVDALLEFEKSGKAATPLGMLHNGGARQVLRARDQLLRVLHAESRRGDQSKQRADAIEGCAADESLLRSLLAAFPDRVARRREPGSPRGLMVGGRGIRLAPGSSVLEAELFLCVDLDAGSSEALVRQASTIERQWLPQDQISIDVEVEFDPASERVSARRRVRYDNLLLEEGPAPLPRDERVATVLAREAAERIDRVIPSPDTAAGSFLLRARSLRQWIPELNLPLLDDAQLRELLPSLCRGCRSLDEVRRADWLSAIRGLLTHVQFAAIMREAPEKLQVPSGSHIALQYEPGRPPVLAVRIQELFGLRDTPRIAGGRQKVLLHLLAPNYRPQQITDDLASFWSNTYPQVRKELRARYPKHAWPEDPLSATAQQRPRKPGSTA